MVGNVLDRAIAYLSPQWAMQRLHARATMEQIENLVGGKQGYAAGQFNRLNPFRVGDGINENAIPREQVDRLRAQSWKLYRDNPAAKKIVRSLETKVVGRYPKPASQAVKANGDPHLEFRQRAQALWKAVFEELDYRGRPGRGGQDLVELHKTAFRAVILGGEVFPHFRFLTNSQRNKWGLTLPLKLQLVHADRIDDSVINEQTFYGIEFDAEEQRAAYWVLDSHPSDPRAFARIGTSKRIPASEMTHLYVSEDVDQIRGVPWFSAALLKMRDTGRYEDYELTAAAQAACIVLGYRRSSGQVGGIGLQGSNTPLTDMYGNTVTQLQPGMLLDLGQSGEIQPFNPQRPNANASAFIKHMQHAQATGVPGIKASTLTGDYKGASFSSERAADNDIWPELEGVQDWFFASFSQPIYEQVVATGVQVGYFDGVRGFNARDFAERRGDYLAANWQGPVAKSIKPSEDEQASTLRKSGGRSSPQKEAAMAGVDLQEVMDEIAEFIQQARDREMPEEWIMSTLGIQAAPVSIPAEQNQEEEPQDDGDEQEEEETADEAIATA